MSSEISGNHDNYWVREIGYIMNEMLYAIDKSNNSELSDEIRQGYAKRASYLRDRATLCINNAWDDYNNSTE